jgi:hypothetical protein
MAENIQGLFKEEKSCRICGKEGFEVILDLGRQPLANALISKTELDEPVVTYPLTLVRCPFCGCLQIRETVSPDVLFTQYLYFSSYADTLVASARELSARLISEFDLGPNNLVVDLGSNDGYLLQFYKAARIPVLGVEPAENVAKVAQEARGIPTLVDFFDEEVAERICKECKPASIIHANNVIAHLANLHGFVDGMRILLALSGVVVVEVAYVKDMIDTGAFDLIYHEHLCYYSLSSLELLFQKHQLEVFNVEHLPAHGGSLRVYAGHPGAHSETRALHDFRDLEKGSGMDDLFFYEEFGQRVVKLQQRLTRTVGGLKQGGCKIVVYGAAAKATVLLNYFHFDEGTFEYIVDRNPEKQHKILPGTKLSIYPAEQIEVDKPKAILITAWNYAEEIMNQLSGHKKRGGKFIIPLPALRIVG